MATKTYILNFFLIVLSFQAFAKTDEQLLAQWTLENEQKLLQDHPMVASTWFQQTCLKLAQELAFKRINQCHLFRSESINAFVFNNGHVYFSTAMMKLINNKHQWASILAHEEAHVELQHYLKTLKKIKKPGFFFPKKRIKKLMRQHEQQADDWSQQKLIEKGFKPEQINYFLYRVQAIQADGKTSSHLKLSKRIHKVKQDEIINQDLIQSLDKVI